MLKLTVALANQIIVKDALVMIDSGVWERGSAYMRFLVRAFVKEDAPFFFEAWFACEIDYTNPDFVSQAEDYIRSGGKIDGATFSEVA